MTHVRSLGLAAFTGAGLVVLLGGCDGLPSALVDARESDGVPPGPTIQVDYGGSFATRGHWDLSRPFGPDGIGGVVADLMIDQIISLAGVPSALEDEARGAIAGQVRAPIVTYVNGVVPTDMLASSPTMMALDAILSDVTIDSTLTLVPGSDPDQCSGNDTITRASYVYESQTWDLPIPEISSGGVQITSAISGRATGPNSLAIADHPVQLHYGDLVATVARDALGVDVFALAAQAWDGVSCPATVDTFTTGAGFTITVASQTFSVTDAQLETACDTLKVMLADQVLGMFRRDAGLTLGGGIRFGGPDSVASEPGYDGVITLFPVVTPQMTASFTGTRAAL